MSIVGTSSQTPRFSPDTLPGLVLWLDAADAATFNGGATWTDKSGTGNHGINGTPGSSTMPTVTTWPNGLTAARFVKASKNSVKTTNAIPNLDVTYFFVVRLTEADGTKQVLMINNIDGRRQVYTVASSFPAQVVALSAWPVTPTNIISATQSVPFLYSATLSGGFNIYVNGADLGSSSLGTSSASQHYFGAEAGDGGYLSGDYGEILIYSTVLTTAQRQQVEGYLARKWGISEMIGHPYRFGGSGILPTQIPGCLIWLDAADSGTLTLSGSNVTQWRDKSGNANHFSTLAGTSPTYSSNEVAFPSGGVMRSSASIALTLNTYVVIVFKLLQPSDFSYVLSFTSMSPGGYTGHYSIRANAGILCGTAASPGNEADFGNANYFVNGTFNPSFGTATYSNSPVVVAAKNTNLTGTTTVELSASIGRYFVGRMYEVMLFSSPLTATQRQQMEGYLANKWGTNLQLPAPTTNTPYAGALLPMRPFSPLDIDGLSMWLDAADRDTLTLSGSNVTAWRDKTGVYTATVMTNSPTYTAQPKSYVQLAPGQSFVINNFGYSPSWAVFLAMNTVELTSGGRWLVSYYSNVPIVPMGMNNQDAKIWGALGSGGRDQTGEHIETTYAMDTMATADAGWYRDGTLMSNVTPTLNVAAVADAPLGFGDNPTFRNNHNGTFNIYECLIYKAKISATQRQQVESYLAEKWGLRGSMGGVSHPYRFGPAMVLPSQIPGCTLWLDAADTTTLTLSGSNVTAWANKSGTASLTLFGTAPTYVSNQVVFNSSGRFRGAYALTTQTTIFAVYSTSNTTTNARLIAVDATNAYGNIHAPCPLPDGSMSDFLVWTGGSYPTNNWYTTLTPQTGLRMYSVALNGVNPSVWRNGSTATMGGTSATATGNGSNIAVGADLDGQGPFNGGISELILFSAALTTLQRQQVEGYLAWKWGLQSNLPSPTTSWPQLKRALTPVFTPTQIPGCVFWIDAADAASMTLSGSNVTQWRDKSSNGVAGTAVASPVLTTVDGVPAVTFNGTSQYIDFGTAGNLGSNQFHIFTVSKFNTTADGSILARVANGDQYYRYTMLRVGGVMYLATQADTGGYGSNASFSDTNTSRRLLSFSWDRSTIRGYQNGTLVGSGSYASTATYTSTFKLLVAGYNNSSGGTPPDSFFMNGSINEILFYFGPLTTAQRQRIEGYLAEKWGLRGSLGGLNHPSRFGPPMILPTQISGCRMWLDAADTTTLTLSGSNVSEWRDKSGVGIHHIQTTASNQPTYGTDSVYGRPGILFNGTSSLLTQSNTSLFPISNTNTYSIFTAHRVNSNSANIHTIYRGATPVERQWFRWQSTFANFLADRDPEGYISFASNNVGAMNGTSSFVNDTTTSSGYINGTLIATVSKTSSAISQYLSVGGTSGQLMNGSIFEVIVFNRVVTAAERQQVEGYLAWKWGLQANLPTSTHPYKAIKP